MSLVIAHFRAYGPQRWIIFLSISGILYLSCQIFPSKFISFISNFISACCAPIDALHVCVCTAWDQNCFLFLQFNFVAVSCGVSATTADDRQALVHQLTSNGWREDGIIWHCTSECASNVHRAQSTINHTTNSMLQTSMYPATFIDCSREWYSVHFWTIQLS